MNLSNFPQKLDEIEKNLVAVGGGGGGGTGSALPRSAMDWLVSNILFSPNGNETEFLLGKNIGLNFVTCE